MADAWDERRRAQEDQFFDKQNKEALARLSARGEKVRRSPITGEPMEQLTIRGVVVDRCPTSKGIWLDAGELEQIIAQARSEKESDPNGWLKGFLDVLRNR